MKTRAQAEAFFAALQRAMKAHGISSIEVQDGRVVFFDVSGSRRCCSFESLDLMGEALSDCVTDPGYPS